MSAMSGQREYKIPNQTNKFVEYSDLQEMEGMLRVAIPPSQWRNRDFVGRGSGEVELPFTRTSGLLSSKNSMITELRGFRVLTSSTYGC